MHEVIEQQVLHWSKDLFNPSFQDESLVQSCQHETLATCKLLPFKIISFICFGELLGEDSNLEILLSLVELHDKIFASATFNKWARYYGYQFLFYTQDNKNLKDYKSKWRDFCIHMVESSRRQGITTPVTESYAHVESNNITEDEWLESKVFVMSLCGANDSD